MAVGRAGRGVDAVRRRGVVPGPVPASAPRVGSPRPRIAVGAGGRVAVLWNRGPDRLEAAVGSAATGRLEPARTVATAIGFGHDVALGPDGTALAVWTARGAVLSSRRPAGAPAWGPPVGVAPAGDRPRLAVDELGTATAVFVRPVGDFRRTVAAASLAPGAAAWDPPADLSPPPLAGSALGPGASELDVASGGRAVAVWTDVAAQREPQVVRAATRAAPGAPWTPAATISPPARNAFAPTAGADAAGGAVATWTQPRAGGRAVMAAVRPISSGAWRGPWVLSRPAGGPLVLEPQVAIGDDGRGLVAWAQGGRQREGLAVRVARLSWPAAAGP
jgi:hypothetical protein